MTSRPRGWLLALAAVLAAAGTAAAEADTRLAFQPASRVLLAGSTNLHGWRCATSDIDGQLWLSADPPEVLAVVDRLERAPTGAAPPSEVPGGLTARLELAIPVAALDCGNRAMERDLRRALDAARHPAIRYRFERVEAARVDRRGAGPAEFELVVRGTMSLAGATRPVTFTVHGRRSGPHAFELTGSIPLAMTWFGIEPPTALLGLIRVDDELAVDVRLVLELDATSAAAWRLAAGAGRGASAGAGERER